MVVALNPTGRADWTDYQDYWRDDDAEWLQDRTILRYANAAARSAAGQYPTPTAGQVTYNQGTDQLELFNSTPVPKWIGVLASQHIGISPKSSANDTDSATIGHRSAGGAGIQFFQTVSSENKVALNNAYLDIGAGAIVAKATGITTTVTTNLATTKIKTPGSTITATLTTNASSLVCDSPFVADSGAFGAVSMSGALTGATSISATTASIGGASIATNTFSGSGGVVAGAGHFYGDATYAYIRQRDTTTPFTHGSAGMNVSDVLVTLLGTNLEIYPQTKIYNNNSIDFYLTTATLLGHLGPVVVSATTPTVGNYPEGTIWVTP